MVVTGIAMTTALATDADSTWKKLLDGQSGIRTLDDPFVEQYDLPVRIGGHLLEDFDRELTRVELRRLSYLQKMSTVLSRRVWENAGSPEVDTKRLMVSIGTGMGSTEELRLRLRRHARARVCGRCRRWPCRCTCPTARPRPSGWSARPRPGSSRRSRRARPAPRASPRRGATSCSARPTSRSAAASRPRSRRCRSPGSPRCASCCPPPTTTRPVRVARSTRTATGSCSARPAR